MKLGELAKQAVCERDAAKAGRIADALRSRGFNYEAVFAFVNKCAQPDSISHADWEALMYESDWEEGG